MCLGPEIFDRTFLEHLRDVHNLPGVRCEMNSYTKQVFKDKRIIRRFSGRLSEARWLEVLKCALRFSHHFIKFFQ